MQYRIFLLLFCIVAALPFTGCSKDDQPTDPVSKSIVDSYYPTTKGSYWKYRSHTGITSTSIVSGDTVVEGQKYAVVIVEGDSSVGGSLVREQGGNIYIRHDAQGGYEGLSVKTTASIGDKWDFTLIIYGIESYYEYSMVAKGITKTVNGREYKNVLQTHTALYLTLDNEKRLVQTAETFFAKGVGMISTTLSDGQELNLVDYQIK